MFLVGGGNCFGRLFLCMYSAFRVSQVNSTCKVSPPSWLKFNTGDDTWCYQKKIEDNYNSAAHLRSELLFESGQWDMVWMNIMMERLYSKTMSHDVSCMENINIKVSSNIFTGLNFMPICLYNKKIKFILYIVSYHISKDFKCLDSHKLFSIVHVNIIKRICLHLIVW